MVGRQLTYGALVLGLMACTSDAPPPAGFSASDSGGPMAAVTSGAGASWIASLGAPGASRGGEGVGFAASHADVAFAMDAARLVRIAQVNAIFELSFTPPASQAMVPIGSVDLSGTLTTGCGSLVIAR